MKFEILVNTINQTHQHFQQQASKAVNVSLTLRNWLIGYYIVEFEQNGEDRAKYGDRLFKNLAERISIKGLGETILKISRQFYNTYPEIKEILFSKTNNLLPLAIRQSLTDELHLLDNESSIIRQSPTDELKLSPKKKPDNDFVNNSYFILTLIQQTSFTHFTELIKIENPTKRKFFELLILKTTPNVRELQRQINTLAFERVGLSENCGLAFEQLQRKIEKIDEFKHEHLSLCFVLPRRSKTPR